MGKNTLLRIASLTVIACSVIIAGVLLLGQTAFADNFDFGGTENLAGRIICNVYTELNEEGDPIPHLTFEECPDSPEPPPPPPPPPACADGLDNDGDGLIDSEDPGCTSPTDTSEDDEGQETPMQCANGSDDDGDGLSDIADPGCHSDFDAGNASSYDAQLNDESASAPLPPALPACSDGLDNDSDGKIDTTDPGCSGADDTDETDPTSGGSSTTTGSSGGGGGGGGGLGGLPPGTTLYTSTSTGQVLGTSTTVFSTVTASCEQYLTAFIRSGQANDVDQVKRLQRFLRDYEGERVVENGTYDAPTLIGVHRFQTKYAAEILAPWGISESTGYLYLTTRKKVNEIVCKNTRMFPLTVDELKKIETARLGGPRAVSATPVVTLSTTTGLTTPAKKEVASSSGTTTAGTLERIRGFLRGIFVR